MGTKIFTINPGSTSTKIALYDDDLLIFSESESHDSEELKNYPNSISQLDYRMEAIKRLMDKHEIKTGDIDVFAGRGGLLRPLKGGVYSVNDKMLDDLSNLRYGDHASNLGAVMAQSFAEREGKPAYIVNPVVVDELMDEARYSGLKDVPRKSIFHALNQKSVAGKIAREIGYEYDECNLIVAHLGGGVSVGAHKQGRIIDVTNALEEGPFSPERAGTVPTKKLVEMCFSGEYTEKEIKKLLVGKGGLYDYAGTKDVREVIALAKKDDEIKRVMDAFVYGIAKEICAMSAALKGDVDRIVITGGIAHDKNIVNKIGEYVSFIAPIMVSPGEDELRALAEGALSVVKGEAKAMGY